ncbi:MAG: hypothetical protein HYV28_17570 [Ignavibacteriales bacterium]|nr:hypothetical protein [Ignavibacteriales bacterium]
MLAAAWGYAILGSLLLFGFLWSIPVELSKSSALDVVQNILKDGSHRAYIPEDAMFAYAGRMPAHSYLTAFFYMLSPGNIWFSVLLKNLVFMPVLFYAVFLAGKKHATERRAFGIFAVVILCNPVFLVQAAGMDVEEGFIIPIIALIAAGVFFPPKQDSDAGNAMHYILPFVNGVLLLLKSSLMGLCLIIPYLYYLQHKQLKWLFWGYGVVFSLLAAWGAYNYANTGVFNCTSSINGLNFYKGNCAGAYAIYPKNLDSLILPTAGKQFASEWEKDTFFFSEGSSFAFNETGMFADLLLRKFYVFFLDWNRSPYHEGLYPAQLKVQIIFFVLLRLLFLCSLVLAVYNAFGKKEFTSVSRVYLLFVAVYSLPFIAGFAYTRHVLPLMIPALLYLVRINRLAPYRSNVFQGM